MKFNKNLKIAAIAILILIIALMLVMVLVPKPKYLMHCYDGVLNSGEEDVDCGGPCETECGAHQYTFEAAPVSATDIAVTTDFILLLDEMRHRVMAFHKDSFSHIDSIGETKGADDAGNLMFNSGGLGNETFIFPCSIDTYKDQVYVVDRMNQKIKVFSKDLDLVSVKDISYLVAKIPSFIDAPGIDAGSIGFAVAGDEDFYLSDELTNKIVHIPGDEVSTVGSSGKDQLEFSKPYDLDIGPDGNVYVAEYANERIQVLSPDLKFVKFINLEGIMPKGISVGEDKILVTDGKNHQVVVLDMSGKVTSKFGSKGDSPTQFYIPTRVLLDNGMIYVVDSGNQKLAIYDNDQNLLTAIEGPKTEMMGASFAPFFIAVSSNKDIFVSDPISNKVLGFNADGPLQVIMGESRGYHNDQFNNPTGLAIDSNDNLYVSDKNNNRIQIFDKELNYVTTIEDIYKPMCLSINWGTLYAVEDDTKTIKIYNNAHELIKTVGHLDGVILPLGILSVGDNVYMTDDAKRSIKIFDLEFNLLDEIMVPSDIGELNEQLAMDKEGNLLFNDLSNRKTISYNFDTKEFAKYGDFGTDPEPIQIMEVTVSPDKSTIYVTDMRKGRVKVFNDQYEELFEINGGKDNMLDTLI